MIEQLKALFEKRFGHAPRFAVRAPGRVNLLGEHVDYNEGFVLPAAIDRAAYILFAPARGGLSTLLAADFGEEVSLHPETLAAKSDANGLPLGEWARYPAGVMWALRQAGLATPPMQAVLASDVPRGAGLSSSAAVEMAFALAWSALGGWTLPPMQLARLALNAESQYVGLQCGIMDQFASACGVEDHLLLLDCRSLEWQPVRLPPGAAIVAADTGVRRKLTSGEYNQRRAACEEAVRLLSPCIPGIRALRDVSVEDFNRIAPLLPDEIRKRARHVVEEIARTQQAAQALMQGDAATFGRHMNACHTSLRDLYEVSCPELDAMVRLAQELPGCYGARLTGAGFGGCTVNLVREDSAAAFIHVLAQGYHAETGISPQIYLCRASRGASVIEI